jgi:TolB protein
MLSAKNKMDSEELLPLPAELPPVQGLDDQDEFAPGKRPRVWLWTLIAAMAVTVLMGYVIVLGAMGVYDGLKDRTIENQRFAQEHYTVGLAHLNAGEYELAIAEFELALRHDSSLSDARAQLREAKHLAESLVTPTSETRQDAAELLYRQAAAHYESGNLAQAVVVLDELRGLDVNYQQENVETMLVTAHQQLGLNDVREDRLEDAREHFEAVLMLKPGDSAAQDQLNLIDLYTAALNYWERDWAATIQSLKGLYALAPDYKDVRSRLHNAYVHHAQSYTEQGNWCRAADEYAAAVEIMPLETVVDMRDDAAMRCQATAEAPPPTPTAQATARPTAKPTAKATDEPGTTPTPGTAPTAVASTNSAFQGRIAFASFDATRRRYDIYVVNLAQGDASLLREHANQPAFAPGSRWLAFRNLDPARLGLGIWNLRGNELSELTTHVEDSTPAWSPDTQQMVFASNKHGDRKWRIYAISPQEVRGEGEEWAFGEMPAWAPDGNQIAYHGCDERGDNCGVWVMQPGGFSPVRLTSHASDTAPAWSPDGDQLAFISSRAGNWEIYLIDIVSGRERRLTEDAASDVSPVWSPDGKHLAFLSSREGGWAVYVLEIKSGQVHKIIATGDAYPDPVHERLAWVP